jgi:hypothetical protein
MKKIIACLPLLFIALTSCDKKDENAEFQDDLKTYNLKGDVKSIQERSYEVVNDKKGVLKRENSGAYDVDLEFDKNHQLQSEKSFTSAGKLINTKTFEFKDRMLTEDEFLPNSVIYKTKYTFDGDNNTIISKRDKDGKQIHRTVNTFEKGLLTQKRIFDNNDQLIERYTYIYDKNGNVNEVVKYNAYEALYKDSYGYDSKNNRISEARFDQNGNLSYQNVTKYKDSLISEMIGLDKDSKQLSIEKREYDQKGNLVYKSFQDFVSEEHNRESSKYDASGNLIQWNYYIGELLSQSINYKYDEHKNLTQMERLDERGLVQENKKYIYEYDEKGNWIKKTILNNDSPSYIIERKIAYY